jgi:hypothetical protein
VTAPNDPQTAAQAAVGRAQVLDKRTIQDRAALTHDIVRSMQRQNLHATAPEAVAAVDWHYANNREGNPLDGVLFTTALRRSRVKLVSDRAAVDDREFTGRQAQDWQAAKALVLEWPCPEPRCEAGPGERCMNRATNRPYGDRVPGHPARIVLAFPRRA